MTLTITEPASTETTVKISCRAHRNPAHCHGELTTHDWCENAYCEDGDAQHESDCDDFRSQLIEEARR